MVLSRTRIVLLLPLLLLMPADGASAADPQAIEGTRTRIEVPAGIEIDRAVVRGIQRIGRLTIGRMVRRFDLTSEGVLRFTGGVPAWFRPDEAPGDRIRIAIAPGDITPGATALSPEQGHEIARRTALDVLRRTVGQGIPLWVESGIADHVANEVLEGSSPVVAGFRKDLAAVEFDLEWMALLGETNRAAFRLNRGRPLAWALVALLTEANTGIVPATYARSRKLIEHLSSVSARLEPDDRALRKEYTEMVRTVLTLNGQPNGRWSPGDALKTWVREGYPAGVAFRSSTAAARLRPFELPPTNLRVSLRGAFDMPYDDNGIKYRTVKEPKVEWSLPWPSRMALHVGLRGMRGTAARYDPAARNKGEMGTSDRLKWDAKPSGKRLIKQGISIRYRPGVDRFGFLLLQVTSPYGVSYSFFHEWKVK